ncbi:MAG: tetratricopeptide repeat protein [wastewater metagenome]|nr:tetratricopeptide repeat protein [Candidatus Loosdrechtia aerotolerans]
MIVFISEGCEREDSMRDVLKNRILHYDKLVLSLLIAAVIIVPLFFDIRLHSVFDLSKVTALYLLTIAIVIVWSVALSFTSRFPFVHTPLDIPILAYLLVFIISSMLSINPLMSLFGTYKRFEGLTATVCYLFLFYTVVNFVTTKRRLYLILVSIIAGAFISSCYGIAQHLGFDVFTWSSFEARRVFSTFGNPVFFSAYLVMVLPLAVVLFFNNPFEYQELSALKNYHAVWIFFVASLIIYTTFWLTNTRACFVALLGGLVPLLFFISKRKFTERYKLIVLIIPCIIIGILFNIRHETSVIRHFSADVNTAESSPGEENQSKLSASDTVQTIQRPWIATKLSVTGSSFSRIFQYMTALKIIQDYPVFGIGPDTIGIIYQRILAKVFSPQESDGDFIFPRQDRIHNDILDTAVTRGILGLSTYIWLLTAFGIHVGRNFRRLRNENKLLMSGILAGIVCYLIQNEFSFGNTPIVTLFWMMIGLCISLGKINEADKHLIRNKVPENERPGEWGNDNQTPGSSSVYKWVCCGIILTTIGFVLTFVIRVYRADAYFEYGRKVLGRGDKEDSRIATEKGLFLIKHAISLNPYEVFYRDELCRAYLQMAFKTKDGIWIQRVHEEVCNSLELIPQHYLGFFYLGIVYQMLAENAGQDTTEKAIAYYKTAIKMDPFQASFHSNLASLYSTKGEIDPAIQEFYQAYLLRPHTPVYAERLSNVLFLQKGDLDDSCFFLNKAIEGNPEEPRYYNTLGCILNKKGMHEEAVRRFRKAREINPEEPMYVHNLASSLAIQGKYTDAVQVIQAFHTTYPDHRSMNIRILLAQIYIKTNNWEKAIPECEYIIRMDNKSSVAYKMLGISYYNIHQYGLAKKVLDQAAGLNANDQEVKDLLTRISLETNRGF